MGRETSGSPGTPESRIRSLASRVVSGDERSIARAISVIENEPGLAPELIRGIFSHTGRAYVVGVTGPPGAGKSTLVDRLATEFRRRQRTVGIIAVDPTSPYSGGAVLGDRVRMQGHAADPGVFIRSMATRGHLGGLARATQDAALVLDAAGRDIVIIETVGVGQDEIEIARTADVTIVTLAPGAGDEVQALKAGIMEIGDIFVLNKAEREGADRAVAAIEVLLALVTYQPSSWRPPVVRTVATAGEGVVELLDAIDRFRRHPGDQQRARRRDRSESRLRDALADRFSAYVNDHALAPGEREAIVAEIAAGRLDPFTAAAGIMRRVLQPPPHAASGAGLVLDHIGVAVADLGQAADFYEGALGLTVHDVEDVPTERVRVRDAEVGQATLEILEPTAADSPIGRFLARHGPGLHHITLRVGDIGETLNRLKARGVRLIDEVPRRGAGGALVAFIHPHASGGVLIELKQEAPSAAVGPTDRRGGRGRRPQPVGWEQPDHQSTGAS